MRTSCDDLWRVGARFTSNPLASFFDFVRHGLFVHVSCMSSLRTTWRTDYVARASYDDP